MTECTYWIRLAVPAQMAPDAEAIARGILGRDEVSFDVPLVDAGGAEWVGTNVAGDLALLVDINHAMALQPALDAAARWATVVIDGEVGIAGSDAVFVGARVTWASFLGAAGLSVVAHA